MATKKKKTTKAAYEKKRAAFVASVTKEINLDKLLPLPKERLDYMREKIFESFAERGGYTAICFHGLSGERPVWFIASDLARLIRERDQLKRENKKLKMKVKRLSK